MTTRINSLNAPESFDSEPSSLSPDNDDTTRDRLRKLTGVSLTALRATMRAATGISSTAIYASTKAATGAWIRTIMKAILAPFPASFRYFLQPFLVLYYAPLFILRIWTGPTRKLRRKKHEEFLEGWKHAVKSADEKSTNWPLRLDKDGYIEAASEEVDVNEAIAASVEEIENSK
jgi:hypothetical protein